MGLVDEALRDSCTLSELLRCIHVGLLCVQQIPEDRPTMSSVVLMLSSESLLPKPRHPGFYTDSHKQILHLASTQLIQQMKSALHWKHGKYHQLEQKGRCFLCDLCNNKFNIFSQAKRICKLQFFRTEQKVKSLIAFV
jgi:hypothetical protein